MSFKAWDSFNFWDLSFKAWDSLNLGFVFQGLGFLEFEICLSRPGTPSIWDLSFKGWDSLNLGFVFQGLGFLQFGICLSKAGIPSIWDLCFKAWDSLKNCAPGFSLLNFQSYFDNFGILKFLLQVTV